MATAGFRGIPGIDGSEGETEAAWLDILDGHAPTHPAFGTDAPQCGIPAPCEHRRTGFQGLVWDHAEVSALSRK